MSTYYLQPINKFVEKKDVNLPKKNRFLSMKHVDYEGRNNYRKKHFIVLVSKVCCSNN